MSDGTADEGKWATVGRLRKAAEAVERNAAELYREGLLLRQHGAFARAAALHQISNEECAKVDMIGAHAASCLMGLPVDEKKFVQALASHKAKNFNNAYFSAVLDEERAAKERGDPKAALEAFRLQQANIHREANELKNSSLYVNMRGDDVQSPLDLVSEETADEMAALNLYFLDMAGGHVSLLRKLDENVGEWRSAARRIMSTVLNLKGTKDPLLVMRKLLKELVREMRVRKQGT